MRRYAYQKTYTWNPKLAYLAGIIASDGCLSNDGRHLIITSRDEEVITTCQSITNTYTKVRIKHGQFGTSAYDFQFGNVALYDFLLQAGITPAKSKTIGALKLPDAFYADFLRGHFDGDGTVYGYKDPRWRNSYMYYVGFTGASRPLLEWLQRNNQRLFDMTPGKIKPGVRASTLTYAKSDAQKLYLALYHAPGLPLLTRKYVKFRGFILSDPYAKIIVDARVL